MSGLGEATFHLNHSCFRSFFNFLIFISSAFCHNCVNTIENLSTNQKRPPSAPKFTFNTFSKEDLRETHASQSRCVMLFKLKIDFFFLMMLNRMNYVWNDKICALRWSHFDRKFEKANVKNLRIQRGRFSRGDCHVFWCALSKKWRNAKNTLDLNCFYFVFVFL